MVSGKALSETYILLHSSDILILFNFHIFLFRLFKNLLNDLFLLFWIHCVLNSNFCALLWLEREFFDDRRRRLNDWCLEGNNLGFNRFVRRRNGGFVLGAEWEDKGEEIHRLDWWIASSLAPVEQARRLAGFEVVHMKWTNYEIPMKNRQIHIKRTSRKVLASNDVGRRAIVVGRHHFFSAIVSWRVQISSRWTRIRACSILHGYSWPEQRRTYEHKGHKQAAFEEVDQGKEDCF